MKNSDFYFLSCKYCTFSLQPLRQKSQIFAASPYTGEAFYRLPLCPVHTGQRGLSPTTLKRMLQSGKEEGRSGYAVSPALTQTGETKCSEFLLTRGAGAKRLRGSFPPALHLLLISKNCHKQGRPLLMAVLFSSAVFPPFPAGHRPAGPPYPAGSSLRCGSRCWPSWPGSADTAA